MNALRYYTTLCYIILYYTIRYYTVLHFDDDNDHVDIAMMMIIIMTT